MRSWIRVITTPTADTPGTLLLLHFDSKRYLIGNLAEGSQRACVQMGIRLTKVSDAFITGRTEWSNTGGMIGMILTLADSLAASKVGAMEGALKKAKSKAKRMGVADDDHAKIQELQDEATKDRAHSLSIVGPRNLNHTLATARRYVFRKNLPLEVTEVRDEFDEQQKNRAGEDEWAPYWADDNVKVWAMSVSPLGTKPYMQRTESRPICPRKRSIEESQSEDEPSSDTKSARKDLSPQEQDYLEVKAVVSDMFNSTWRLDTLHETKLGDVKLPATLFVRNPETKKIERYSGPLPGQSESMIDPDLKVLVRKPWPGALVESLPNTKPCPDAISYIFKSHTQRGKFLPEKAKELKVKQGPSWNTLAKGQNVLNEDGETITPDMVLGPSKPGGGIAIIDLPTPGHIDPLINRPEWRVPEIMEGVGAIFWLCGQEVATDQRLHAFMKEFKHLEHIVSSPDYCTNSIALHNAAASTMRLRQVDPDRYGIPVHDAETADGSQAYGGTSRAFEVRKNVPLPDGVHIAARGVQVELEPSVAVTTKEIVPNLDIAEAIADMPTAVTEEATKAQQAAKIVDEDMQKWLDSLPPGAQDTEVITLGTGSALPSKYRNVSATLVRVPNWGSVLLDCGENTLGQLRRVFTDSEFKQILQDLRIIFISHMHADHQLGTTSVIKTWYQEVHGGKSAPAITEDTALSTTIQSQKRLAVVSEPAMQQWLAEYSAVEDFGYSHLAPLTISPYVFGEENIPSQLTWFTPTIRRKDSSDEDKPAERDANDVPASALDLAAIDAVAVQHCHGARAVSITFPSGVKISYSGDCRPSRAFARIGRRSTVCIHEATFDDELAGDAVAKKHSTTSEALGVAQDMRAHACVLTHFSQRYQKVPVLEKAGEEMEEDDNDALSNGEDQVMADAELAAADAENDDGPVDGHAATMPDQVTVGEGQQYDLPASSSTKDPNVGPPEAVKFKLRSDMKVCVAFDYMRIKVKDIAHMEKFIPALLKLFEEEEKKEGEEGKGDDEGSGGGGGGGGDKKQAKKNKKKGSTRNN